MLGLQVTKELVRRWFISIPAFVLLGLILGGLIAIWVIPKPNVATITISGPILGQAYVDDALDMVNYARENDSIKAVVLRIDTSGGGASAVEEIYLDVLRLRQQKPVVVSVGTIAASGGYYVAVASDFIYAEPTSQIGSIGAWVSLPQPEELDEDIVTTGPFKATGGSRRKVTGWLEMLRQDFVEAVMVQRGDRLQLSGEELSRAEIYLGTESLRYGLIDAIGTRTDALEKAADLAHIRNYGVMELEIQKPVILFFSMEALKSQTGTTPVYYYLYFESE